MPPQVKQIGITSILTALFTFMIIGAVGWIGMLASRVPELKQEIRFEVKQLNKSIVNLAIVAKETNTQLKSYTKYHSENLARITESLVDKKYKIQTIEKKINKCEITNAACREHLLLYEHENGTK